VLKELILEKMFMHSEKISSEIIGHITANSIRCCVACCYHCSMVCLCIYLSVYLLITIVRCAKTNEPIEIPFGAWTRLGPRNHVHTCIRWELKSPGRSILGVMLGHAQTCLLLIFLTLFLRRQELETDQNGYFWLRP